MSKINRRDLLIGGLAMTLDLSRGAALAEQNHSVEDDLRKLDHERFMRLAIEQGLKVPNCPFGAVIVNIKTEEVVANGWVRADKNPIWHGEMTAIYNCPDSDKGFNWKEVCLYTTGEPCPMCQAAIVWSGMPLVVYGCSIPTLQKFGFGQINIRSQTIVDASTIGKCKIIGGVLQKECEELFSKSKLHLS
jgi:tRNA(Arg) A34 adenosine deaminase TadA